MSDEDELENEMLETVLTIVKLASKRAQLTEEQERIFFEAYSELIKKLFEFLTPGHKSN